MEEIWKDVVGYEGLYKVSNLGNIMSLRGGVILKPSQNNRGYLAVGLFKDGAKRKTIHRLVAMAFLENPKAQVNHINGIKSDNRPENLQWCTNRENCIHYWKSQGIIIPEDPKAVRKGTGWPTGAKHHRSKLTDSAVNDIRLKQLKISEYARKYSVSISTVCNIQRDQKRWKHVNTNL